VDPVKGSLYDDDVAEGVMAADPLDMYLDCPVNGSENLDADEVEAVEPDGRCRDAPTSSRASTKCQKGIQSMISPVNGST
jgi:hypothetical protein